MCSISLATRPSFEYHVCPRISGCMNHVSQIRRQLLIQKLRKQSLFGTPTENCKNFCQILWSQLLNFMTRHCRNLLNFSDKFLLSDMCYTVVFFLIYMVILYINMYNRCMQTSPAVNVRAINVKKL